jgi:hypothetical protein
MMPLSFTPKVVFHLLISGYEHVCVVGVYLYIEGCIHNSCQAKCSGSPHKLDWNRKSDAEWLGRDIEIGKRKDYHSPANTRK